MVLHLHRLILLSIILIVMYLEKRLQSEDRAHRIGQKKPVTYVDIIAEDTVDEKISKSFT